MPQIPEKCHLIFLFHTFEKNFQIVQRFTKSSKKRGAVWNIISIFSGFSFRKPIVFTVGASLLGTYVRFDGPQ